MSDLQDKIAKLRFLRRKYENGQDLGPDEMDLLWSEVDEAERLREKERLRYKGWKSTYVRLEQEILRLSRQWSEHPEIDGRLYYGPCECSTCRSYD